MSPPPAFFHPDAPSASTAGCSAARCKLCMCYIVRAAPLLQCWSEGSKRRGLLKGRVRLASVLRMPRRAGMPHRAARRNRRNARRGRVGAGLCCRRLRVASAPPKLLLPLPPPPGGAAAGWLPAAAELSHGARGLRHDSVTAGRSRRGNTQFSRSATHWVSCQHVHQQQRAGAAADMLQFVLSLTGGWRTCWPSHPRLRAAAGDSDTWGLTIPQRKRRQQDTNKQLHGATA